ncbi:hypothetical protein SeMB42_g06153 [Synchytrium endobioticum]|uniref:Ethylmalonyl-CoA decarboxylase n=1 Tax=Synchytrium endobioticum TaxID=286115 RepID=A0A507CK86_9FUNG|nr:hypothetical protein SeMB42_g06153 [Synchytrium endobioticum]
MPLFFMHTCCSHLFNARGEIIQDIRLFSLPATKHSSLNNDIDTLVNVILDIFSFNNCWMDTDALDALEHEASDPKSNMCGVILMGDDHSFCSGFDLSQAAESFMTSKAGFEMATLMHSTLLRLKRLPMISVAAVDGFALGGGAELSTACDFRVVAKNASIRFVHLSMGVTTAFGGGTMLTNIVGRSTALRLLLSSPTLHAEEAFALGLCDQIAQDKQVYEESVRLLNTFLYENSGKGSMRHPVQVVRAMKKVVSMADELPARDSLEQERDLFQTLWGGEANMAAIRKSPVSKKKDAI